MCYVQKMKKWIIAKYKSEETSTKLKTLMNPEVISVEDYVDKESTKPKAVTKVENSRSKGPTRRAVRSISQSPNIDTLAYPIEARRSLRLASKRRKPDSTQRSIKKGKADPVGRLSVDKMRKILKDKDKKGIDIIIGYIDRTPEILKKIKQYEFLGFSETETVFLLFFNTLTNESAIYTVDK